MDSKLTGLCGYCAAVGIENCGSGEPDGKCSCSCHNKKDKGAYPDPLQLSHLTRAELEFHLKHAIQDLEKAKKYLTDSVGDRDGKSLDELIKEAKYRDDRATAALWEKG